nr:hypothetical protein [Tanacetum cinerariifolium]
MTSSTKQSYASVANGDVGPKADRNNGEQDKVNRILLSNCDLITIEDTSNMVLVKVKEVDSISIMYRICSNEGFDDTFYCYEEALIFVETVKGVIHGVTFDVYVREIGTWSIHIKNDLDCSDSKDGDGEDEDRSCNMEENHNKVLDDFIEQVVEKKVQSNSINDVQQEKNRGDCNEYDAARSKPPGFEKFIKMGESTSLNLVMNDYMENPKEVEDKEVDSSVNIY